jgi:DNA-binding transcriptional LysR family regulator
MGTDHWPAVEVRHLESLRAIARAGSFHGAADDLEYTQSAVSQHLAALEAAVGLRLVERGRGRRTVELTEAGTMLLGHADAIVARLNAARADLRAYAAGTSGILRVGTYQSVGARILPTLLSRLSATWPDIEVQLRESNTDEGLLGLIESGELDLTFAVLPLAEGPFDRIELLRDPYVLMVAAGSPLAREEPGPTLSEIAAGPLIGFSSCRTTRAAESYLSLDGVPPRIVFRSDDNGTVQGLVAAGVGSALVPSLTVDEADDRVVLRAVDVPPRVITLAWHRGRHRSPASLAFVELARDVCAALRPPAAAVTKS